MKPLGTWNGIKHYCFIKSFSLIDFSDLIDVGPIENLKLSLIGKNGYKIEVRPHPTNNMNDAGLCEVSGKKIILYVPGKLDNTDTYVLFGSGTEIEFDKKQLCITFATELMSVLDYIWNHSLPNEVYVEYLTRTIIWT
jgi:hypothetical protein